MSKTVRKVFLIIGTLVLIFLIWQLVFNDGGIIKTAYNALANGINGQWEKVAGKGKTILPTWDNSDADKNANGEGFNIDTGNKQGE